MSKTFRLAGIARRAIERVRGFECDLLDLSLLTTEYGRQILACKACISTVMPVCHWPCSRYPNHAMGQVNDWMNEIYPRWVEAQVSPRLFDAARLTMPSADDRSPRGPPRRSVPAWRD